MHKSVSKHADEHFLINEHFLILTEIRWLCYTLNDGYIAFQLYDFSIPFKFNYVPVIKKKKKNYKLACFGIFTFLLSYKNAFVEYFGCVSMF